MRHYKTLLANVNQLKIKGLISVCPWSRSLTFRIQVSSTLSSLRRRSNLRCKITYNFHTTFNKNM